MILEEPRPSPFPVPLQEISYRLWASLISGRTSKCENVCFLCVFVTTWILTMEKLLSFNVKYCYILLNTFFYFYFILHNWFVA